jgi:predicted nucleotide-binding protein
VATPHALVRNAREVDFAALVLTPDDLIVKAGEERPVARDNVLFEAGLFMGSCPPGRSTIVGRLRSRTSYWPSGASVG